MQNINLYIKIDGADFDKTSWNPKIPYSFLHWSDFTLSLDIPKQHFTYGKTMAYVIPSCGFITEKNIVKSEHNKSNCTCISCINMCNNKDACFYCQLNLR